MAALLRQSGVDVPEVADEDIDQHLAAFEGNPEFEKIIERVKLDSWAWEEVPATLTVPKEDRTVVILEKLGVIWPEVNQEHIKKMIEHCVDVGFL